MVTKEVIKCLMTNDFDYGQIDFQGITSAIGEIAIEVMGIPEVMDYGPHVAQVDLYQYILNRRDLYKANISLNICSIPE